MGLVTFTQCNICFRPGAFRDGEPHVCPEHLSEPPLVGGSYRDAPIVTQKQATMPILCRLGIHAYVCTDLGPHGCNEKWGCVKCGDETTENVVAAILHIAMFLAWVAITVACSV